ncbi:MAG TPA: LacI family DNA-binding transcriptional regulator [Candidatus Tumulicola sp.]|nr:LacI family DNA-binding transcriptional regulator [Candidatus Tumulicola sp.]
MGKVTVSDIAAASGLSRAAISLVLQDSNRVSAATKVRVRQIMSELGYVYDRRAANLRTQKSMIVGLIVTNVRNPYFAELTMSIEQRLQTAGYTLLLGYSHDEDDRQRRLLATMTEHRVDGIVLLPAAETTRASLAGLDGTPHVLIARRVRGHNADYAGVANVKAGALLGRHLIDIGARDIAFVGGPAGSIARTERERGLRRELETAGVSIAPQNSIGSPSTPSGGIEAAEKLLEQGAPPDVIVCYSDAVAFGVLHTLHERGLRIGHDVAVAGFDDTTEARHQNPPLTSVATFPERIGEEAARLLLERIDQPDRVPSAFIASPELNVRESTSTWTPLAARRRPSRSGR